MKKLYTSIIVTAVTAVLFSGCGGGVTPKPNVSNTIPKKTIAAENLKYTLDMSKYSESCAFEKCRNLNKVARDLNKLYKADYADTYQCFRSYVLGDCVLSDKIFGDTEKIVNKEFYALSEGEIKNQYVASDKNGVEFSFFPTKQDCENFKRFKAGDLRTAFMSTDSGMYFPFENGDNKYFHNMSQDLEVIANVQKLFKQKNGQKVIASECTNHKYKKLTKQEKFTKRVDFISSYIDNMAFNKLRKLSYIDSVRSKNEYYKKFNETHKRNKNGYRGGSTFDDGGSNPDGSINVSLKQGLTGTYEYISQNNGQVSISFSGYSNGVTSVNFNIIKLIQNMEYFKDSLVKSGRYDKDLVKKFLFYTYKAPESYIESAKANGYKKGYDIQNVYFGKFIHGTNGDIIGRDNSAFHSMYFFKVFINNNMPNDLKNKYYGFKNITYLKYLYFIASGDFETAKSILKQVKLKKDFNKKAAIGYLL